MDYRKTERGYLLRIDRGEELIATLTAFLAKMEIRCGAFTGIGAVDDPELGLFTMKTREYLRRRFAGEYEIASITGNVTTLEGVPFPHVHGVFTDVSCTAIGGHLFEAEVAVTCELDIVVHEGEVKREPDEVTGLNLMFFGD